MTLARSFMTSNEYDEMIKKWKIHLMKIYKKILERVEQLSDNKRNSEIGECKKKLEIINSISNKLYNNAKNDMINDKNNDELIDPVL